MTWKAMYKRSEIPANTEDYYRQLNTLVHELGHLHGVGRGEYYTLNEAFDNTGTFPDLDVNSFSPLQDPYWESRIKLLDDPMVGKIRDLADPAGSQFGSLSSSIINKSARYVIAANSPNFYEFIPLYQVPINPTIEIVTSDRVTGQLLAGCYVTVYSSPYLPTTPNIIIAKGATDAFGRFTFLWGESIDSEKDPHSIFSLARLVKGSCPGYRRGGQWISGFDLQAGLHVANGGSDDDFRYHGTLELRLDK